MHQDMTSLAKQEDGKEKTYKEIREENLRKGRWKKGQSGNPVGPKKKERMIQPYFEDCLGEKAEKFPQTKDIAEALGLDPSKCTVGYLLAHTAVMHALKGKQIQFQEILNRMDGKVKEQIFHEITPKLYGIEAPVDEV